ncbi:hypothetical protein YB2330_005166 [Saitoella coloradoensis]
MRLDVGSIAVATLLCSTVDAFWRLPCGAPVVVERMDPIVNPGIVSSHVHTIMGSDAINFTNTFNSLRAADCTTCQVTEDLSNYWTPNLWFQHPNGSFTSVPQIGGMLVYYLQRYNSQTDTELVAFPDGFRMVAGNPMLRSYYPSLEQRAISWMCINYVAQSLEKPYFPLTYCPQGLRAQVFFPSCWDGVNLDSANHKSHVAYPSNMNSGTCPPTHPIRLISLFYEVMFDVAQFSSLWTPDGVSQPFVLANGDPTGYGLHGDFMNGWNRDVLQRAIDNCTDMSGDINVCEVFDGMLQTTQEMSSCVAYPQVVEDVSGTLDELPGCNPVQSGGYPSAMATMPVCTLKPETMSKDEAEYEEFLLSPHPVNYTGWHYLGCYSDSSSRTLPKQTWLPAITTPSESCMDACAAAGYTLAGLEYYGQCFCGNTLPPTAGAARPEGECWMPCTGNSTQICGGDWRLSIYQVGAGKKFTWKPEVKTTRTVSYSVSPSPPVLTTASSTVKTTGSSMKASSTTAKGSSTVGTVTASAGAKAASTASTSKGSSTSSASAPSSASVSLASCTINCGSNSCCPSTSNGQQCYNPSVYTCIFETSGTGKVTLCSFGMDACNGGCFDPSKYRCEGGKLKQGAASTSASSSMAASSIKASSVKVSSSVESLSSVKTSVQSSAKASTTKTTSKKASSTAKTSVKTTSSTKASTKVSATSSVKSTVNLSGLSAAAVAVSTKTSSVRSTSKTTSSSKLKVSSVKASSTKATLTAVSTAKTSAKTSSIKASSTVKSAAKTSSVKSTSAKATSVVSPSALLLAAQQTTGSFSSRKSTSSVKTASSTKKASLTDVTSTQTHTTTTWTTDTTVWVDPSTSSNKSTSTKVSSVKSSSSSIKATSSVKATATAKSSVKNSSTSKVSPSGAKSSTTSPRTSSSSAAKSTTSTNVSSSVKSVTTSISSTTRKATSSAAKTSSSAVKSASSTSASVSMKATSSSKTSSATTKAASSVAKDINLSVKSSTTTTKASTMTSMSAVTSASSVKSTAASSTTSSATPATSSASATFISQMLTMHNNYRAAHSAQPLAWNKNLEKYAQNIASTCAFGDSGGSYGENMGLGTNSNPGYYLQKWYNEQNFYDYDTPTGYSAKTEHFTQVVWNTTTQVGCAFATNCGSVGPYYYPYLLVCEYWRAGNVNNTGSDRATNPWKWYKTNVLPSA